MLFNGTFDSLLPAGGVSQLQSFLLLQLPLFFSIPHSSAGVTPTAAVLVLVPTTRVGSKHNECTVPHHLPALFNPELEANKEALIHAEPSGAPPPRSRNYRGSKDGAGFGGRGASLKAELLPADFNLPRCMRKG